MNLRKLIFSVAAFVAVNAVTAQADPEKYAATITREDLKKQLTIVASAEMEGRETATEGQRKAAAYLADQFKQIGLLPAPKTKNYLQHYPLFYDTITNVALTVDNKALAFGKDFLAPSQSNRSKK